MMKTRPNYFSPPFFVSLTSVILSLAIATADEDLGTPSGPVNGDNPNIGIKYDESQGLRVTPFSAKLLNLKMADVEEKEIASQITLQTRIFGVGEGDKVLASAWLPQEDANKLKPGHRVAMQQGLQGEIADITTGLNQQAEVLVEISDPDGKLKMGKFLAGTVEVKSNGEVVVVPKSAVVKSAEGAFAYVDNAGWTIRTEIGLGAENDGYIEIVDGLYYGDVVVTAPVMTLWMTELQLLKSGKA